MHKILKSLLPTEGHVNSFQRLCNLQIEEMRAYDAQMKMVKKDPENYHSYPAPISHPDIMSSIVTDGDDYNIEFEIVDDTPKPTLEEKKMALVAEINSSIMKIQSQRLPPPLKQQLAAIEFSKIPPDPKDQTAEQKVKVAEYNETNEILLNVNHKAAIAFSEIDDLTESDVDKYKVPDFSEFLQ